ncbi:MAG: transposase family protein [Alteromonas stellipolaris]|uniref:integrase catalytic domain-containing protein n=1 Tax=Alteromonas stellipolaris TaxID=233316 RepID=UPI003B8C0A22
MTIIQKNDVFEYEKRTYRILSVEPDSIVWFELEQSRAWPTVIKRSNLVELVMAGEAHRVDDSFVAPIILEPSDKHLARRDNAYETIKDIVEHPFFYDTQVRIELSNDAKSIHGTTDKVINKRLKRYWTFGQSKNALYPKYAESGAAGKPRTFTNKRSGRPRKNCTGSTAISTEDVRRLYRRAIEAQYFKSKTTFSFAYRQFKLLYMSLHRNSLESEIPTEAQMRHFYKTQYQSIDKAINRVSPIEYRKDVRALVGTATAQAHGPGARYEVDATTADVYLVSDDDPNRVIGRPTLYILIDVFSRMVAGFYIGFEAPSYQTVLNALVSAAMPKDDSLKEVGETNTELWPVSGLPEVLLADKGSEFFGKQSNNLLDTFTIHVENAPAYRGDAKGIVERFFGTWQNGFKNVVDGVVTPSRLKKAGERDYRLDANVPISEFRRLMIAGILSHNHTIIQSYNHTSISRSYDRDKDIPDTLPMTPIDLWNWGTQNRSGALKSIDKIQLIAGLLPKSKATTSALGLCLFGVYYEIKSLQNEGAFLRQNFSELAKDYVVAYDPLCLNTIYVFVNGQSKVVQATIHKRSRQFIDMRVEEVKERQKIQKGIKAAVEQDSDTALARIEENKILLATQLQKSQSNAPKITGSSKISAISDSKKQAQKDEHLRKYGTLIFDDDKSNVGIENDEFEQDFHNPTVSSLIKKQSKDA